MTYLQQLRDSYVKYDEMDPRSLHVPFIHNSPQLHMEYEINGHEGMMSIFRQSVHTYLSELPSEYYCRLCTNKIPHEFSEIHLKYGSTYSSDGNFDMLSELIYGCCESCSKKISRSEIDQNGNLM